MSLLLSTLITNLLLIIGIIVLLGVLFLIITYGIIAVDERRKVREYKEHEKNNSFNPYQWRGFKNRPWNEKNN